MTTLVLAKQDHIENGNLPESFLTQVFESLISGQELYLDSKLFTDLDLTKETVKVEKAEKTSTTQLQKLIKEVATKCKSSKGFMGIELDGVKNEYDVFQNILDEICVTEETVNESDIEEELHLDMTVREANGYISKMKTFIKKNAEKYLTVEDAQEVLNSSTLK